MQAKLQDSSSKVAQLEQKLSISLDAIAYLVQAVDKLRSNDPGYIFDIDLAKHALNEVGYPFQES